MVEKKEWRDFRSTGLLLIINQILHIFGWAIVFESTNNTLVDVYPARVKFRGFDHKSTEIAYRKISRFMVENARELLEEAEMDYPQQPLKSELSQKYSAGYSDGWKDACEKYGVGNPPTV